MCNRCLCTSCSDECEDSMEVKTVYWFPTPRHAWQRQWPRAGERQSVSLREVCSMCCNIQARASPSLAHSGRRTPAAAPP